METILVVMLKNKKTGFLEKEITSLTISECEEFLLNIYAEETPENKINIHLKITTDKDVKDWEYNAILDYYDLNIFENLKKEDKLICVIEETDNYNPTWEIIIPFDNNICENLYNILKLHKKELLETYETIKDKEGEYTENEN